MGLTTALNGLISACVAAINNAGIPNANQVGRGNPQDQTLVNLFAQTNPTTGQKQYPFQATVYPLPGGESDPYPIETLLSTQFEPSFSVSTIDNVITFAGAIQTGVPVHLQLNGGQFDLYYVTQDGDTFLRIGQQFASQVTALAVPGLSVTPGVSTLTVTGATSVYAIVVSTASSTYEVGRIKNHRIQVSIWAPNDATRQAVEDAIIDNVGTNDDHGILLSDGTTLDIMLAGAPLWSDKSTSTYSLYVSRLFFMCEYPLTRTVTATEIAAGQVSSTGDGGFPITLPFTFEGV